jgi:hypothetical protein
MPGCSDEEGFQVAPAELNKDHARTPYMIVAFFCLNGRVISRPSMCTTWERLIGITPGIAGAIQKRTVYLCGGGK